MRHKGRVDSDDDMLSEAEILMKQFYAGERANEKPADEILLPKIDNIDQLSLRKDVFARFVKPRFTLTSLMIAY